MVTAVGCNPASRGFESHPPLKNFKKELVEMEKKQKMKKIYLVHGWGGTGSGGWFDWIKKELKGKAEVYSFDMPNTEEPKIEEWVGYLEKQIDLDSLDEHTYFIGHSIGCQTIIRFLEKLHKHKRVGGCVFVAGWFDLINLESEELTIAHPWTNTKISFERVLDHCNNFLAMFSMDDPYVHIDEAEKFKERLGAKIIIKENKGHFNEVEKIPEILEFL